MLARIRLERLVREAYYHYLSQGIIPDDGMVRTYVASKVRFGLNTSNTTYTPAERYSPIDLEAVADTYESMIADTQDVDAAIESVRNSLNDYLLPLSNQLTRITIEARRLKQRAELVGQVEDGYGVVNENLTDSELIDTALSDAVILYERGVAICRSTEQAIWYTDIRQVNATANNTPAGIPDWGIDPDDRLAYVVFGDSIAANSIELTFENEHQIDVVDIVPIGQYELSIAVSQDGLSFDTVVGTYITGPAIYQFRPVRAKVVRIGMNGDITGVRRIRVGSTRSATRSSVYTKAIPVPEAATAARLELFDKGVTAYYALTTTEESPFVPVTDTISLARYVRSIETALEESAVDGLGYTPVPIQSEPLAAAAKVIRGYRQWLVRTIPYTFTQSMPDRIPATTQALTDNPPVHDSADPPYSFPSPMLYLNDGTKTWLTFPVYVATTGSEVPSRLEGDRLYEFETNLYADTQYVEQVEYLVDSVDPVVSLLAQLYINDQLVLDLKKPAGGASGSVSLVIRAGWNRIKIRILRGPMGETCYLKLRISTDSRPVSVADWYTSYVPYEILQFSHGLDSTRFHAYDGNHLQFRPLVPSASKIDDVFASSPERIYVQYTDADILPMLIRLRFDIQPGYTFTGYRLRFI